MYKMEYLEKLLQLKIITVSVVKNAYWLDNNTFVLYFNFTLNELKEFFTNEISDDDSCLLYGEYHEDEHKIVYILEFEDESIDVSNKIQSINFDLFILDSAKSF